MIQYGLNFILIITCLILLTYGSNLFIKWILSERSCDEESTLKNGSLIGNLERIIIFIAIIIQEWSIVALIAALKSIARFKDLDKKDNAEYFLIGTLSSILLSIVISFIFIYLVKNTTYFTELQFLFENKIYNINIM